MTEHASLTLAAPPALMAPAPHCPTCRCRVSVTLADDPAWRSRSAALDAEIEAMFREADRLLRKGGRGAE